MDKAKFVILGGGMAAGYAARQFVESGLRPGDLAILSADTSIPYERPPLSKGFLSGKETEENIRINPEGFYRDHGIELKLECPVTAVDPVRRSLTLATGGECGFEKLVLATGARARTLAIPGATLNNVRYLRSLEDSRAIRASVSSAMRAVVIGGGFIGMEVASVLAQKQIETTMVFPEQRVWQQFFTPEMSRFFEGYFAARGVHFSKGSGIARVKGASAVESVELVDGKTIACDLLVAGIGAAPNTELLATSGISLNNGVVVNEYLETSHAGILAAGDIANYPDVIFGKRRRVEHWDNAVSQGQHCAKVLLGERTPFRHVPYFFSDVFDLSYEFWGDPGGADQTIHRGDLSTSSFSVWWLRGAKLVAAFAMNRPDEEREAAPKWIESGQRVAAEKLENESAPLSQAAQA